MRLLNLNYLESKPEKGLQDELKIGVGLASLQLGGTPWQWQAQKGQRFEYKQCNEEGVVLQQ
jgi:hypothetical protein